ncbi:MAG: FAD-binding oxidoreductase, partial [Candidatus Acidiferrales bacterium]
MKNRKLIKELQKILGKDGVLHRPEELLLYEYDAGPYRTLPDAVVFPRSAEDVVRIVRLANQFEIPLIGRGAG